MWSEDAKIHTLKWPKTIRSSVESTVRQNIFKMKRKKNIYTHTKSKPERKRKMKRNIDTPLGLFLLLFPFVFQRSFFFYHIFKYITQWISCTFVRSVATILYPKTGFPFSKRAFLKGKKASHTPHKTFSISVLLFYSLCLLFIICALVKRRKKK